MFVFNAVNNILHLQVQPIAGATSDAEAGGGSSVFYDGIKREGLEGITLALVELALELDPMRKPFN